MTDWLRSLDAVGVRFAMAVRLATINKDQAASAKESLKFSYRELSWAYYSLGQVNKMIYKSNIITRINIELLGFVV
jgi:hypothetical protein